MQHHPVSIHQPHQVDARQPGRSAAGSSVGVQIPLSKLEEVGPLHLLRTDDAAVAGIGRQRGARQCILHHLEPLHGGGILPNLHMGLPHNQGTASLLLRIIQGSIVTRHTLDYLLVLLLLEQREHRLHLPLSSVLFHAGNLHQLSIELLRLTALAQTRRQTGSLQHRHPLHALVQPRHGQQAAEELVGFLILAILRLHLRDGEQ